MLTGSVCDVHIHHRIAERLITGMLIFLCGFFLVFFFVFVNLRFLGFVVVVCFLGVREEDFRVFVLIGCAHSPPHRRETADRYYDMFWNYFILLFFGIHLWYSHFWRISLVCKCFCMPLVSRDIGCHVPFTIPRQMDPRWND